MGFFPRINRWNSHDVGDAYLDQKVTYRTRRHWQVVDSASTCR